MPRLSGLALSPDGSRLVTTVATLDADGTGYRNAVWEVDPTGSRPSRRLTRGAEGERHAGFTATGDVLFTATRPDPDRKPDDGDQPVALWLLPASGEARVLVAPPGGVDQVHPARRADTVVFGASVSPNATDLADDARLRKLRRDGKVSAILHRGYPVRFWAEDLGPDEPRLMAVDLTDPAETAGRADDVPAPVDLTGAAGAAYREVQFDVSADGRTVVSTFRRPGARGVQRAELVVLERGAPPRTVVRDDAAEVALPCIAPDGRTAAFVRETDAAPHRAPTMTLHLVDLADGSVRDLAGGWDRWPSALRWLPDGSALLVTADDDGRGPVFVVSVDGAAVQRLTPAVDTGDTFTDLQVAPDGSAVYALRTSWLTPPHPVRIELSGDARGTVTALPAPAPAPEVPGVLTEVRTTAEDGTPLRAWLALPDGAGPDEPAPLLLWIHGGPLNSWNAWSWRWNPWLLVARGYAVLLPDPALSTGYGLSFVQRGWGAWGAAPFTDLMAMTDAAVARPDIDEQRTAAMGGSFGGYMANWVAGHTDRFRAVVTHASLWALDQFGPTTDASYYWQREMTPEMAHDFSPHRSVADIRTPMLVIHGDKDYRVPIGEGLRLWYELLSASGLPADDQGTSPHRFLYFPTEHHWVLAPQHAKLWYQVVESFLGEHVLGREPGPAPEVLG
ncbi:S9 family peptidase [Nakamurella sp. YIM 132084]|uniref:S9 family peptidase n=2 Tax=Nakamurella leprariae TaxID=2803911 RepID=A0A938YEM7_9ACTN|nr:S9 family peptidase [Nakamurella leprariae]